VDEAVASYLKQLAELPDQDRVWYLEKLARMRTGDDSARRAVSGSCLRLAFELAQRRTADLPDWSLLDLVQEANVGLWKATRTFTGSTGDEFRAFATQVIDQRLGMLPTAPGRTRG
jgi:DNA-directed RNA polymerase specialized sigma subunit